MLILDKKIPIFKIYLDIDNNKFHQKPFNDNYILWSYNQYVTKNPEKKNRNLTQYKIKNCILPDGFIEDIRRFKIKKIEMIEKQEVMDDEGNTFKRTMTYISSLQPKIDIIEKYKGPNDPVTNLILTTCWFRKEEIEPYYNKIYK